MTPHKNILILGAQGEPHSDAILHALLLKGVSAAILDTQHFPAALELTVSEAPSGTEIIFPGSGDRWQADSIQSVYWRSFQGVAVSPDIRDPFLKEMASREIYSAMGSFFRSLNCRWVNSPDAVEMHRYKGYQLQELSRQGLRVPKTLITNKPESVLAFVESLNGEAIYKPVLGGAHTQKLSVSDLTPERLQNLKRAPVQFQEYIPGVDIRVYRVGDALFAGEIRSTTLDFRDDPNAPIVAINLPPAVASACHLAAISLGLSMTGIDIRRTPEGEYVFLEANPSPMFLGFENRTGFPISEALISLLLQPLP